MDLTNLPDDAQLDADLAKLANGPELDRLLAELPDSRDLCAMYTGAPPLRNRGHADAHYLAIASHITRGKLKGVAAIII